MNIIKIVSLDNGAHENRCSPWEAIVPDGWAYIPENVELPDSYPFVDIEVENIDGVSTVTTITPRELPVESKEELETELNSLKETKIAESKTALAEYLSCHPIFWIDGKYYSVTSEKQSLLTSNLALYQIAMTSGQPFKLTWNSTGDECVEWSYENLAALALSIGSYVKPFVSKQQDIEIQIKNCQTKQEVEKIEIKYE